MAKKAKKRATPQLTIRIPLIPGVCRWCRCTYDTPCANGCAWVVRGHTLCSECVPLDRALQTKEGRRELAEFLQEGGFLVGQQMSEKARPRRRSTGNVSATGGES